MPRRPDFFIVGAPKCGTTAMADYLGQHPEIGMCARKETHFLVGELRPRLVTKKGQRPPTEDQYLRMFASVQERRRLGESSVWYLYSPTAAREIQRFSPAAQIIVMLRNPVEMLPSLHSQLVRVGLEPVEDFVQALALDPERERSGTPPGFPPRSYRSAVRYSQQIARYLEIFGRERIHAIVYDSFREDTLSTYRTTCEFLGVDPGFVPEIRVVNPNKRVRSRAVRRLVRRPPESLRRVLHAVTTQAARRRAGIALNRINTAIAPRDPASDQVIASLQPLVAEQVEELRAELGLDLDAWLR